MLVSINNCANKALQDFRKISGKNILENDDGASLLNERAQLMGFKEPSQMSANGSCYLLKTKDHQWIALNLSRDSDWALLPALFQIPEAINNIEQVTSLVNQRDAAKLIYQGRTLGLPMAMAAMQGESSAKNKNWFEVVCRGEEKQSRSKLPLVVDLSSLWAGPLCSHLLQLTGARVIKIESTQRPDGAGLNAQQGAREFYARLNQNKEIIILDFKNQSDLFKLKHYIQQADIVIEGSRPRALQQLGINAEDHVKKQPGLVWVSITGYGRHEPQANWVAFGDDAAISAGLFHVVDNKPVFIGDAIADPLTGLHAALAALQFYQEKQSVLLDINLHAVANYCVTNCAS